MTSEDGWSSSELSESLEHPVLDQIPVGWGYSDIRTRVCEEDIMFSYSCIHLLTVVHI